MNTDRRRMCDRDDLGYLLHKMRFISERAYSSIGSDKESPSRTERSIARSMVSISIALGLIAEVAVRDRIDRERACEREGEQSHG